MAIVDVRIDDRLIHGQVCSFWIPYYSVDKILIVDDEIVNDNLRKTALKIGCPNKTKLSILDSSRAADKLKRNLDKGSNVMILCQKPEPLLKMVENGYQINKITIGNMTGHKGNLHVKKTVFLSQEDILCFKKLLTNKVELWVQLVPDDTPEKLDLKGE